jgi:glycosyltransferase involved in cell wall biosynthesis
MIEPQNEFEQNSTNSAPNSVSVILLTYNRADVLDATIDSILSQTMADFELIIADNASPDSTQQVCQRRATSDSRIQYHRRPPEPR